MQLFFRIETFQHINLCEGHFTFWKKRTRDFFRTKGFIRIFDGFFLKTKGLLPIVHEIFGSEMKCPSNLCVALEGQVSESDLESHNPGQN